MSTVMKNYDIVDVGLKTVFMIQDHATTHMTTLIFDLKYVN